MWRTPTSSNKSSRNDGVDALEQDIAAPPASLLSLSPDPRKSAAAAQDTDIHLASRSASVYEGTASRVMQPRNEDSVISLFSNEDIDASNSGILSEHDNDSLSSDDRASNDSSELTALASRPQYPLEGSGTAGERPQRPESPDTSTLSCSVDEMVTPGLHTAGMASLHFGNAYSSSNEHGTIYKTSTSSSRPTSSSHRYSAPQSPGAPPMTLASYLSSTLSSPKTRSLSSDSLASFPTDSLSDVSRAESIADTDDGASEFNSDADPSFSTSQLPPRSRRLRHEDHLRDSSDLVMPKLAPSSNPDSHEGSSPSDSDKANAPAPPIVRRPTRGKQASSSSNTTLASGISALPRILMAGGTNKQQTRVRAALTRGAVTPVGQDIHASHGSHDQLRDRIECVESIAAAGERAERPFTVLQTILRPEATTTDTSLLEDVLPSLLEQAAAVSVCLLILDVQEGKTLAQHVLEQFQRIYELSKLTTLVPILVETDEFSARDSVSQLTQGSIDWLGKTNEARLASLKAKARPYLLDDVEGLASALAGYDFTSSTVKAFQRWNYPIVIFPDRSRSSHGRQSPRPGRPKIMSAGRPPSNSSTSDASSIQSQTFSQEPASLASSMLDSVTLPPSSSKSASSVSSAESNAGRPSLVGQNRRKGQQCYRSNLDPLHLPSLLRLIGLNLATSFTSIAYTVKTVLRRTASTEDDDIRKLLEEDEARSANLSVKPLPATVRPFYGCCRWRYTPNGNEYYQDDKSKCQQCGGIIFAGIVIGIALWFS